MRVRPDVRSQMLVLPCLWYFAYFQIKVLSEHILEDSVHWQQKIGGIDSGFSLAKAVLSSVAQLCPTFCDPMNCSVPGLPVHHHLPEFTPTHVHRVSDAIQPSHPLSPCSSIFNLSQWQSLFQWVSCSYQVDKLLEFQLQHQSFQWISRIDFL